MGSHIPAARPSLERAMQRFEEAVVIEGVDAVLEALQGIGEEEVLLRVSAKRRSLDFPGYYLFTFGVFRVVSLVATFGLTHFTRQFFLPAPAHSAVFLYTKDKVLRVEFTDIDHAGITLAMADLPEEHTVMRIWGKDRGDYIDFDEVVAEATHEEHEPQHRQLPPRRLVPGANTRTLVQFLEQHREKPYCPRTWNCNHFAAALYRHLRAAPSSLS
ncbi:MAG: hypothetical protein MHM6MM_003861 [Cercozoa sp. M6MM]